MATVRFTDLRPRGQGERSAALRCAPPRVEEARRLAAKLFGWRDACLFDRLGGAHIDTDEALAASLAVGERREAGARRDLELAVSISISSLLASPVLARRARGLRCLWEMIASTTTAQCSELPPHTAARLEEAIRSAELVLVALASAIVWKLAEGDPHRHRLPIARLVRSLLFASERWGRPRERCEEMSEEGQIPALDSFEKREERELEAASVRLAIVETEEATSRLFAWPVGALTALLASQRGLLIFHRNDVCPPPPSPASIIHTPAPLTATPLTLCIGRFIEATLPLPQP